MARSIGSAVSRHATVRPVFSRATSPASDSTSRCFMTAGSDIANGCASSLTEMLSRLPSRAKSARRVGSASAAKVRSRTSSVYLTIRFSITAQSRRQGRRHFTNWERTWCGHTPSPGLAVGEPGDRDGNWPRVSIIPVGPPTPRLLIQGGARIDVAVEVAPRRARHALGIGLVGAVAWNADTPALRTIGVIVSRGGRRAGHRGGASRQYS